MAKVLIVGCGDVGSRLALQLVAAGHEVHGLRRQGVDLPGVHSLAGDVTQPETLRLPPDLEVVFVLLAPGESGEAAYRRVYVDGTRHLLAALSGQQQLRRVFWVSSSSVYGQEDGSWVDESSPTEPESPTARCLLEAEALVHGGAWPATVVRFAGIYGPGRERLLRWVREGRPVQEAPPLWTNRIHVDDCAGLLAFLFVRELAGTNLASLYIGCDDLPVLQQQVLDWLADRLALPHVARVSRPGAGSNKRLSNRRILALGYSLRFPDYQVGYAELAG